MSIADHFENIPEAGFTRNWDAGSARRQFNMSLVLIGALAMAAVVLGLSLRFEPPASTNTARSAVMVDSSFAGKLVR